MAEIYNVIIILLSWGGGGGGGGGGICHCLLAIYIYKIV